MSSAASLGVLTASQGGLMLTHDPQDQRALQSLEFVRIDTFIQTTPRRDIRLRVGCALVLAVLNLGATSWVPTSWTAEDVFLVRVPTSAVPQPYFNHASLRNTLKGPQSYSPFEQTRKTLFGLGVVLLKLISGDEWKKHGFGTASMGVAGHSNEAIKLATALMWQRKVEEDLGYQVARAIQRCLTCLFEGVSTYDLSNSGFVSAVWNQVITPMELFLSAWNNGE